MVRRGPVSSEFGEDEIKIVVKIKPGFKLEPEELIRYLEPRMPYLMIPRFVELTDGLPRTPAGEIIKANLRERGGRSMGQGKGRHQTPVLTSPSPERPGP